MEPENHLELSSDDNEKSDTILLKGLIKASNKKPRQQYSSDLKVKKHLSIWELSNKDRFSKIEKKALEVVLNHKMK